MIDEDALRVTRRGRRLGAAVLATLAVLVVVTSVVGWVAFRRHGDFGTFWADELPPRISRCGRDWLSDTRVEEPAVNVPSGLVEVGSTPGGATILTRHTGCPDSSTVIWVRLGPDWFVAYSLSGGP